VKQYTVAVVGATGVVGKEILAILEERKFPVGTLVPLASERSLGQDVRFRGEFVPVQVLTPASFEGVDFALFSAGGSVSEKFVPEAVKRGAICIDNTSHFRMHADVPLVVPEVNAHALKGHAGVIANPNCSTAQLVLALKPIHDAVGLKKVIISTYQSVSGAGKEAMLELEQQTRVNLSGGESAPEVFKKSISFNLIPQIDVFTDNGYTKEELKMVNETRKILGVKDLAVTATCVRVPVFIGHSESVTIETERKISADEVRALLANFPGVEVMDHPAKGIYPTPKEIAGTNPTYVGRIREDLAFEHGISFWCVSDNLRKGAALNAVQIAEALIA
jgi:aspartate-semialdehyde dehydrogenase